jgi:hypothetical protein
MEYTHHLFLLHSIPGIFSGFTFRLNLRLLILLVNSVFRITFIPMKFLSIRNPLLTIIMVNMIPVIGIMFLGWRIGHVVVLFWLESMMIGFFNLLRILFAQGRNGTEPTKKFGTALFFLVHYFGFMLAQGFFMFAAVLSRDDLATFAELNIGLVFAGLLLFYSFNFIGDFILSGEFQHKTPDAFFFRPYGRVAIQQILILGGGWLIETGRLPREAAFTLLLVGMKIIVDLVVYGLNVLSHGNPGKNLDALRGRTQ